MFPDTPAADQHEVIAFMATCGNTVSRTIDRTTSSWLPGPLNAPRVFDGIAFYLDAKVDKHGYGAYISQFVTWHTYDSPHKLQAQNFTRRLKTDYPKLVPEKPGKTIDADFITLQRMRKHLIELGVDPLLTVLTIELYGRRRDWYPGTRGDGMLLECATVAGDERLTLDQKQDWAWRPMPYTDLQHQLAAGIPYGLGSDLYPAGTISNLQAARVAHKASRASAILATAPIAI